MEWSAAIHAVAAAGIAIGTRFGRGDRRRGGGDPAREGAGQEADPAEPDVERAPPTDRPTGPAAEEEDAAAGDGGDGKLQIENCKLPIADLEGGDVAGFQPRPSGSGSVDAETEVDDGDPLNEPWEGWQRAAAAEAVASARVVAYGAAAALAVAMWAALRLIGDLKIGD